MGLVKNTLPAIPGPLANFPSEEIASGLGTVTFFGIASEDSGGINYHLITNGSVWSQPPGSEFTASPSTVEYDFDTSLFNLPRTAKGTAHLSCVIGGQGSTDTHKILVTLIHVDSGDSETAITSEITSQTVTQGPADADISQMVFLELPITEKHFKKGEFLRMTIKHEKISGTNRIEIGHDPANQDVISIRPGTTPGTTVMRLIMPFRSEA